MAIKTKFTRGNMINILSTYNLGELLDFRPIKEGTVQTNYYLKTTKGKFIFRYYENRTTNSVLFEVSLLKYLKDKNFPCSYPLKDKKDEFLGIYNNKPYVVFEFIEGEHIEYPNIKEKNEIIKKVALLHNITKDYKPAYKEHRWNYDTKLCEELAKNEAMKINTRNSMKKYNWLKGELSKIRLPSSIPRGICHCDFHYSNILFKDGVMSGLLDFDDANYTYLLYDLTFLIDIFIPSYDWDTWDEFKASDNVFDFEKAKLVIKEYMKYRPLSDIEKKHFFDVYKLSILFDCIWYFDRGDESSFYEKRKIEYINGIGREEFYRYLR